MTSGITYSRAELYERYKDSEPEAAKKLIAPAKDLELAQIAGVTALITSAVGVIFFMSCTGFMGGFGAQSHFGFVMFCITGVTCGPPALGGLILFAVAACKQSIVLHKRLTPQQVNTIAEKSLIDTRRQDL